MALLRSTAGSKLLGRSEHDQASFPFTLAEWTARSGTTKALDSSALKYTNAAGATHPLLWNIVASRSKMLLYGVVRGPAAVIAGVCAHVTDPTGSWEMVRAGLNITGGVDEYLSEWENEALIGFATDNAGSAKSTNTDYGISLFVDGGGVAVFRDHHGAITITRDLTNISAGQPGFWVFSANDALLRRAFGCTDRYANAVGVPSGGSAEVRKADDTVLASASESSGIAAVDMIAVPLELAAKLVVKNSGGTVIYTYNPGGTEIIEPGENYAVTPGAFTSPVGSLDIADPVPLEWGAAPATGTTYEIDYQRNHTGTWVDVATQSGTTYDFTAPTVGHYRFRVRAFVGGISSQWVESDEVIVKRVTAGTPRTHTEVVASHSPEDGWHLEETVSGADFLSAVDGGYDADGGTVDAGCGGGADFISRDQDGICNAVRTCSGALAATWLETQRPDTVGLFTNDFAFSVWAHPLVSQGGGPPLMLLKPLHANTNEITGGLSNETVRENGMYGLGLAVARDRIAVYLHSDNYFDDVTSFVPTTILSLDYHHIAVVVDVREVEDVDYIRVRLFLDGEYCDTLDGTYVELDNVFNTEGAPLPGHTGGGGADKLSWIATWPFLGSDFSEFDTYGNRFNGYFDEPFFYAYVPDDGAWEAQYLAGRATLDGVPAGAFDPLSDTYEPGATVALAWGAAAGASGYLVERQIDGGAWIERSTPTLPEYDDTLPETEHESVQYRVTPLFGGYAPEACVGASVLSEIFSIESVEDVAALCTVRLDVYEDDGETIAWSISTDPAHPYQFLEEPQSYGEQEIDVVAGAATIGQATVTAIDRRQIAGDQDSGWLTARIAEHVHGRRNRYRRYTETGWVTIADGPASEPRLVDYAAYSWTIRDTRENERKLRAFTNTNVALFPAGVLDGFGDYGEWLVAPVVPLTGTYQEIYARGGIVNVQDYWIDTTPPIVPQLMVVTQAMLDAIDPVTELIDGSAIYRFPNLRMLWRSVSGTTWNELNMRGTVADPVVALTVAIGKEFDATLNTADGESVIAAEWVSFMDDADGVMPTDGQEIEFVLMYVGRTTDDYPFHLEGITTGVLLQRLYDGEYSPLDVDGNLVPTGIRYDATALAQMTDPVRLRITEPWDDLRSDAEKYVYAPTGWIPALDNDGRISPVSQVPPEDTYGLVDIHDGITEPADKWNAGERVINNVRFKYPRWYPSASSTAADGLAKREVTVDYVDAASTLRHGEKKIEYDGLAFGAIGDEAGASVAGTSSELGYLLADDRQRYVLARFRLGAQAVDVAVLRSATQTVRVGDFVTIDLSWFPNYPTARRGMQTSGQVIAINELDCAWRQFLIEEATPVAAESTLITS